MILRNKVELLENSFSPLIYVPKCRHLLHFDIKRAFFKLKLRRMKAEEEKRRGPRQQNSLRITLRRNHIMEDSFQNLNHKSTEEVRRRISVSFHGEEGLDAGGLTREW